MTDIVKDLREAASRALPADDWWEELTLQRCGMSTEDANMVALAHPAAVLSLLDEIEWLRAERDRLRAALMECAKALQAVPAFTYAAPGTPVRSSKETLKAARAALRKSDVNIS